MVLIKLLMVIGILSASLPVIAVVQFVINKHAQVFRSDQSPGCWNLPKKRQKVMSIPLKTVSDHSDDVCSRACLSTVFWLISVKCYVLWISTEMLVCWWWWWLHKCSLCWERRELQRFLVQRWDGTFCDVDDQIWTHKARRPLDVTWKLLIVEH